MSDLITFSLSQLARALGSVPCPRRKMGSSLTQTSLHYFTLNTKWRGGHSLPFMWY
jgi:hypothetical protein